MALNFDGVDDFVDHGDIAAIDGTASLTICMWIKPETLAAAKGIIQKGPATGFDVRMKNVSGDLEMRIAADFHSSTGFFTANTWVHLAIIYDGSQVADADQLKWYKDGVQQTITFTGAGVPTTIPDSGAAALIIGGSAGTGGFVDGSIGLVKIWNAVLTAAQMLQELNSYRPVSTSGLLVWAPYDDGTKAVDYSGNGNHGTVTGALATDGPHVGGGVRPIWS